MELTKPYIIPRTGDWKNALSEAVRDPAELLALLGLSRELLPEAQAAARGFPLRVPRSYLARMQPGDPDDPLLAQVLPLGSELHSPADFVTDPVGDREASACAGLLHKYHGRVLLIATGACAVHCRFCFRRHFPYAEENPAANQWQEAIEYLRSDPQISEVILSGGDPLLLDDRRLADLITRLAAIGHIQRLRIHTRLPIVLPERITDDLLALPAATRLQLIMVIHCNHPAELQHEVPAALQQLTTAGFRLFNQSVLLRGINDRAGVLAELSERLFELDVQPYYLHLLDRVQGAAHFEVDETTAKALHETLRQTLPGYLVPKLVREVKGLPYKQPKDC